MLNTKEEILNKLNKVTIKDPVSGCWLYPTNNKSNYGYLGNYRVNRLSAWIFLDLDLDNVTIFSLHKVECKNKNCWNPDHLYLGNESDNTIDTVLAGTNYQKNKAFCKNGHEFTEENTYYLTQTRRGKTSKVRSCRICKNENSKVWERNKKKSNSNNSIINNQNIPSL